LGNDIAGVVREAGELVTWVKAGDEVMLQPGVSCGHCIECLRGQDNLCAEYDILGYRRDGGYAELVAAPGVNAIRKPKNLSWEEAAALPLVTVTAWHMLVTRAQLQPGEDVLIHAAGSGVGSVGIQIAKLRGARVIATAGSDEKLEKARSLGADEVVDYRTTRFEEVVRDVDVVLDTIGDYALRSLSVLRRGGVHVPLTLPTDAEVAARAAELGVSTGWMLVEPDHAGMLALAGLVDAGKLRVEVAEVVPLAEAARAHELGESNRTTGKIVLQVR
jgi:NADPH:quinone reductase-like Zn-dependent oxidoreductase